MASKVEVILVDDVDGGEADETVTFALDGTSYEIDLAGDKAKQLREQFNSFIPNARRIRSANGATRARRNASPVSSGTYDLAAVRQWARESGHQVSDRGRVSEAVLQAYADAH